MCSRIPAKQNILQFAIVHFVRVSSVTLMYIYCTNFIYFYNRISPILVANDITKTTKLNYFTDLSKYLKKYNRYDVNYEK